MANFSRRKFIALAAALGSAPAWARWPGGASLTHWREQRDLYPEGVASGDPDTTSVILWTRRPYADGRTSAKLKVEVALDEKFEHVVADADALVAVASDWTCRVLVGGLKPAGEYWYRFTDSEGAGSRVGRTLTAPADADVRDVRFAFVSCQNANQGAQNAFRRMIFEDQKAAPADRLGFVLHLGDFIYELVWYPEDRPQGMYDRRLRDIVRYTDGEKIEDFHIPTTTADYRAVYRAYLHDPDIQDARAWFPFVAMWDNHEFSWQGWQALQKFNGKTRPAQTRKVAANQAWFEFHPGRVVQPSRSLERFDAPKVHDVAITQYDDQGLGQEPNNLAAIGSLRGYRALRWGKHVDLLITDQHSYRSADPTSNDALDKMSSDDFPEFFPEELQHILDAGRAMPGGAPDTLRFGATTIDNFQKKAPPQTILGAAQKRWFLDRLKASRATWKIWGNTAGTLDMRADPQNIPAGITRPWPGAGYATFGGGDPSAAYMERAEIYDTVARSKITGFATIAGDRHSFWAGLAAKALPPHSFEPVGLAFIVGSISAPTMVEAIEHKFPKEHPLRALFLADRKGEPQARPEATVNMLLRHGVRSCLEYAANRDLAKAHALSNPNNAPHLRFVDMGGHGYAVVHASPERFSTEFVCIPRPLERSEQADGGPLRYRVMHSAKMWKPGELPQLEQHVIEGDASLST